MKGIITKGLCTNAACQQGKVEQIHIKSKCEQSSVGLSNLLDPLEFRHLSQFTILTVKSVGSL
jgi:hypothetical protein